MSHTAVPDHHRLAKAFLALADDLVAPEPMRASARLAVAAVTAALALAVLLPLAWMAPASHSLTSSSKVGDQPAATLASSKAVLAAADDEDDDGG